MKFLNHVGGAGCHHTGGSIDGRTNIQYVEAVRKYHVEERGWEDIGYHTMAFPDGEIIQCRSMMYQGAHIKGRNHDLLGVCLAGNMNLHGPTRWQLKALIDYLAKLANCFGFSHEEIWGHNQLANTDCPGKFIDMDYVRKMVEVRLNALRANPHSEMGEIVLPKTCTTWPIPGVGDGQG